MVYRACFRICYHFGLILNNDQRIVLRIPCKAYLFQYVFILYRIPFPLRLSSETNNNILILNNYAGSETTFKVRCIRLVRFRIISTRCMYSLRIKCTAIGYNKSEECITDIFTLTSVRSSILFHSEVIKGKFISAFFSVETLIGRCYRRK